MNKAEAAKYLEISERSLERYTSNNEISVRYERGKTKPVPVYEQADLDIFKAKMNRPVHKPAVERMASDSDNGATGLATPGANPMVSPEAMFQLIEAVSKATAREVTLALSEKATVAPESDNSAKPTVPVESKLILTLEEAHLLSGLSIDRLKKGIKEEQLKARKEGRGWKVRRADLESFVDSVFSG